MTIVDLTEGAPDLIEPVIGYRLWRLIDHTLTSPFASTPWHRPQQRARCDRGRHEAGEVPAKTCSCGIHAYYDPCPRTASAMTGSLLGGVVVAWGRIEAHAIGMRVEHARIVGLELPFSRGRKRRAILAAAERLDVPAVTHRTLGALAREHGAPLQRALRPRHTRGVAVNAWSYQP
jgi:hypothetical protein